MQMKKLTALTTLLVVLGLLAACATPTVPATSAPEPTTAPEATEAPAEPTTRIVKHIMGETEIIGTPTRVVVLEWTYVEDVLALGIQPVGVADIEGFHTWVKIPLELSPEVVDVGFRGEPNLETLVALQPDLIIDTSFGGQEYYDSLNAIAPTLFFDPYPTDPSISQYDEMQTTFTTLADILGKQAEGQAVLDHMNAKFSEARGQIEAAGLGGQKFVLSQTFSWDNAVSVRLFTENGMATQIVEQIGLENGWDDGFQSYGFTETSIEILRDLDEDVHFFYVVNADDPVLTMSEVKPVWDSLTFVKEGRAYPLGGDTWLFGGPLSAELLVDIVVKALMPS
jgi:ferric hydroxamate transport system substrate-binding protein